MLSWEITHFGQPGKKRKENGRKENGGEKMVSIQEKMEGENGVNSFFEERRRKWCQFIFRGAQEKMVSIHFSGGENGVNSFFVVSIHFSGENGVNSFFEFPPAGENGVNSFSRSAGENGVNSFFEFPRSSPGEKRRKGERENGVNSFFEFPRSSPGSLHAQPERDSLTLGPRRIAQWAVPDQRGADRSEIGLG